ncbi:hypothetical protein ACFQ07_23055, partial [Actinomadura adrarensis]
VGRQPAGLVVGMRSDEEHVEASLPGGWFRSCGRRQGRDEDDREDDGYDGLDGSSHYQLRSVTPVRFAPGSYSPLTP